MDSIQSAASPIIADATIVQRQDNGVADAAPVLDRLLNIREVEILTSLSKQMIYRKIAKGTFPEPVVISEDKNGRASRVAWSAFELAAWREARPRRASIRIGQAIEVRAA